MKKGFTLVELLIVVVVLVTLMTMVVRLGTVGDGSWRRTRTIERIQRVENCLSGYFAAFGSYPPVKVHGTRNIFARVNSHGIQSDSDTADIEWGWKNIGEQAENEAWHQVEAACRAQPVDARFPFPEGYENKIENVSEALKKKANSNEERYKDFWNNENTKRKLMAGFTGAGDDRNIGSFSPYKGEVEWNKLQLFKFGLMSYLLPRYLVMMNGDKSFFTDYMQWTGNNEVPCDPITGQRYNNWSEIRDRIEKNTASDLAHVANIPSQAVCARWMPNLEGTVSSEHQWTLFGINISSGDLANLRDDNPSIEVYEPGDYNKDSNSDQYVLDYVTIQDGWDRQLFYYSPEPYQSYVLWSAGPNGRTFPPWIPLDSVELNSDARRGITKWIEDDITGLSH